MLCFCLLVRSLESISASADHQCITTTFWCSRIEREKKERKRESVRTEQASHDQMRRKGASEIRALSESEQRFTCCMMCSSSVSSSFSNRGHRPRISVRCCCNRCSVVSTHTHSALSVRILFFLPCLLYPPVGQQSSSLCIFLPSSSSVGHRPSCAVR